MKLQINNETLNVTILKEPQLYKGRSILLSGIAKNATLPPKWVDGWKYHWIYTFRYIGTDEFISFEYGYSDEFVGVVKNK